MTSIKGIPFVELESEQNNSFTSCSAPIVSPRNTSIHLTKEVDDAFCMPREHIVLMNRLTKEWEEHQKAEYMIRQFGLLLVSAYYQSNFSAGSINSLDAAECSVYVVH